MAALTLADSRQAIAEGRTVVAVCGPCAARQTIPSETCFTCGSADLSIRPHDGRGRVFSWVVCHFAFAEQYRAETPYTVVLVALDGGARVYGRYDAGSPPLQADMTLALDPAATKAKGYLVYRPAE